MLLPLLKYFCRSLSLLYFSAGIHALVLQEFAPLDPFWLHFFNVSMAMLIAIWLNKSVPQFRHFPAELEPTQFIIAIQSKFSVASAVVLFMLKLRIKENESIRLSYHDCDYTENS